MKEIRLPEFSPTKIAVWPDNSWCWEKDIEDSIRIGSGYAKSDDYMILDIPEELVEDDEGVERWLAETNPQNYWEMR